MPAARARLVTLQMGNGASACCYCPRTVRRHDHGVHPARRAGDGTRSGDPDPAIPGYLARQEHLSLDQVHALLNGHSGLLGVSGTSADMADLLRADALVFAGGIGERSSAVRARIWDGMAWCGLVLDDAGNTKALGCDARISGDGSMPSAWVVAVDEASVLATDALACLERTSR